MVDRLIKFISPNKLADLQTYYFAMNRLCEHYFKNETNDIEWYVYNGWEFPIEGNYVIIKYSYENIIDREHPTWESDRILVKFEELTRFWLDNVKAYEGVNKILDSNNES